MATPKYDSMPEYREALSERARGLDGLLEPLRSEALQLFPAGLGPIKALAQRQHSASPLAPSVKL